MLTDTQVAIRSTGIGASESAAALGLSPYATPLDLYLRKRGEAGPQEDSLAMRFGNAAEAFILSEFQRAHPDDALVLAPDTMRRGPMLAHLDAWVPGRFNVQAKTARSRHNFGESGSPDVPMQYLIQVQHEMLLAGVAVSFVPVLFAGSEYDEFVVEADRELQEMIEAGVADFWHRVQIGDPPDPISMSDMQRRYGHASRADVVIASDDVQAAVETLQAIKHKREDLDLAEDESKLVVLKAIGECDTLVDLTGKTLATWKAAKPSQRFDAAAFKAAHPELHAQFLKAGEPTRRFLIK